MRIFMLVPVAAHGPVPKLTTHLVDSLHTFGCTVVTHPWGRRGKTDSLLNKFKERLQDLLAARRVLKGQLFDVAIVATAHDWRTLVRDIPAALVIRSRCRPVILHLHGSDASRLIGRGNLLFKLATSVLLSLVDGVLVLSSEERRQWQAFRARPPVFMVKNPYVRVFPARSKVATAPSGAPRALFVGRLIQEKGIFDVLDALPNVLEGTQCELVIVGEGEHEESLRARVKRLGLESHVTMAGYLSGSALAEAYLDATIFVLPTYWNEGFPTVLVEAMDTGLPIVTTRIRGAADHLAPGENALFVPPRDVKALASAMTILLTDRDLRARMTSANHTLVEIFQPDVVAAEYLAIVRSVTEGFRNQG